MKFVREVFSVTTAVWLAALGIWANAAFQVPAVKALLPDPDADLIKAVRIANTRDVAAEVAKKLEEASLDVSVSNVPLPVYLSQAVAIDSSTTVPVELRMVNQFVEVPVRVMNSVEVWNGFALPLQVSFDCSGYGGGRSGIITLSCS